MKVKVKCDGCSKKYKINAKSMKQVREYKRVVGCTCMKCMSTPKIDFVKIYGNTVMLVW